MAGIHDLLNWIDNGRRTVGRNLSDLINSPKDYLEGVVNELPNTVRDYASDPMNFVGGKMGGVAQTAWHGSPHKFSKFSLDKIGTGEGAQAYGHGLYLAESPGVAKSYAEALGSKHLTPQQQTVAGIVSDAGGDMAKARSDLAARADKYGLARDRQNLDAIDLMIKQGWSPPKTNENLYKTDIPDEAVARFLDWDKPLSQQAPEVQKILSEKALLEGAPHWDGQIIYSQIADELGKVNNSRLRGTLFPGASEFAATKLKEAGIPGIRYLDGGSRSAGQGSSNFVAFDPEMIRILERNGQATGLEPWKPGEYRLKDLIGKE